MSLSIVLLAGGVGGAKMAEGLMHSRCGEGLSIIGNIGDDQEIHGLWVSPDIDTLTYTLTERIDRTKGWGLKDESNHTLDALALLGVDTWMYLGDQDFATHIYRTEQRKKGLRPSVIAADIAAKFGLKVPLLLATDDNVPTRLNTDRGWLDFQSYFVRYQCQPEITAVEFQGAEQANATPETLAAIAAADLIIFAPSNPIVSIGAILAIPGIRSAIDNSSAFKMAVSPIIAGKTVKGPADKMLRSLGFSSDALGVAQCYQSLLDLLVIDSADQQYCDAIRALGMQVACTDTLMPERGDKVRLAEELLDYYQQQNPGNGLPQEISSINSVATKQVSR
ncbi:MAG: 2-phospho-L-lactate transferase [Pseudomonadales bacterium]|nr:2-phospho-L-lactate transferase [Pseudomonadales bacterium]